MNTAIMKILSKAQTDIRTIANNNNLKVIVVGLKDDNDKILIEANELINSCCKAWDVDINAMKTTSRKREYVLPRQASSYILKQKYFGYLTLNRMATIVGYGDHSDFIHAYKKAEDLLKIKDDMLTDYINKVKHLLDEKN